VLQLLPLFLRFCSLVPRTFLFSGAKIFYGWIVRELGGRPLRQILPGGQRQFSVALYLTMDNFLSMNAFEPSCGCSACHRSSNQFARAMATTVGLLFGLVAGIVY